MVANSQFVMSTEQECLTSILSNGQHRGGAALQRFFEILGTLAPTMSATSGIFNPYGRVYVDCGHVELAACECDSPYLLASVVERQNRLVAKALEQLRAEGHQLLLANNNHSGLLQDGCPIWGAHENLLVEQHPSKFGDLILPFLVTRIFGGAGGIIYPTADFLAAVRPVRMEQVTGGGTTEHRAIHSTAREEHHMGTSPQQFRYHLILGDGHRSQFNLALQFGATALALKAIFYDKKLPQKIRGLDLPNHNCWLKTLREFNLLATPGHPPKIDPLVIKTQQVYLDGARRYVDLLGEDPPEWVPRMLRDWDHTLQAMKVMNRVWLSQRLDAFAKYEFYSAVLVKKRKEWGDLPRNKNLFNELALLDHSYHEFGNPNSAFDRLERAGVLKHRVTADLEPGKEADPFIPETKTRASTRAKFIRDNAKIGNRYVVDWSWINDLEHSRLQRLTNPFADKFEPWTEHHSEPRRLRPPTPDTEMMLADLQRMYDRGEYELANLQARHLERRATTMDSRHLIQFQRLNMWIAARRGAANVDQLLDSLYNGRTLDLLAIADYCFAMRVRGLVPHAGIQPWVEQGFHLLAGTEGLRTDPAGAAGFRDHAAAALCGQARYDEALELLDRACRPARLRQASRRLQGRLLAALGDVCRVLGKRRRAARVLLRASELQESGGFQGDLAEFTLTALARLERTGPALERLATAREIVRRLKHHMALARILLIESRVSPDAQLIAENRAHLHGLCNQIPALADCPRLATILSNWEAWISNQSINESFTAQDKFWGV